MANNHLTDKTYLRDLNFKDEYYLVTLCQHLWEFIKNAPIPIYTSIFKNKNDQVFIKLSIGDKAFTYEVDTDISYFDFIYRFKLASFRFYPQFEFEEEIEVELDTEEMLEKVATTDISLNDVVFLTKKILVKQQGFIHKVMLSKDEFLFEYNGKKYIRTSLIADRIEDVLPVKQFLQNVRNMYYDQIEGIIIKDYIFNNSKIISELPDVENDVTIDYKKSMMLNFFKIHYNELKDVELTKEMDLVHRWGKFRIVFEDSLIEDDCIKYYRTRRQQNIKSFN